MYYTYFVTVLYKDMTSSFGILHLLYLRSLSISGENIYFIPNPSIKRKYKSDDDYNSVETYNFYKVMSFF